MKNFKSVAMGFVAGSLCMVTVTAMAAYSDVTAKLWNDVTFNINGSKVDATDQPTLNYNGYTYVPLRFITESLGGKATYDTVSKTVSVDLPEKVVEKEVEVIKEVPVYIDKETSEGKDVKYTYSSLPQKSSKDNYTVEITGVTRNTANNTTKILITVDNSEDSSSNLQLQPTKSKLTVNGKEVALTKIYSQQDDSWYLADIQPDEEKSGFVTFELTEDGKLDCDLELVVRDNTNNKEDVHEFHFSYDAGSDDDD